jgi:hypothetical protein
MRYCLVWFIVVDVRVSLAFSSFLLILFFVMLLLSANLTVFIHFNSLYTTICASLISLSVLLIVVGLVGVCD